MEIFITVLKIMLSVAIGVPIAIGLFILTCLIIMYLIVQFIDKIIK